MAGKDEDNPTLKLGDFPEVSLRNDGSQNAIFQWPKNFSSDQEAADMNRCCRALPCSFTSGMFAQTKSLRY